jgi:hypothetical protein
VNFDAWVELSEASRISSEPILQRYFERPTETRKPTDEERASSRSSYGVQVGRRIESIEQDEAAYQKELDRKRERDRRRGARKRELEFNSRTIAADEPVPEAS